MNECFENQMVVHTFSCTFMNKPTHRLRHTHSHMRTCTNTVQTQVMASLVEGYTTFCPAPNDGTASAPPPPSLYETVPHYICNSKFQKEHL